MPSRARRGVASRDPSCRAVIDGTELQLAPRWRGAPLHLAAWRVSPVPGWPATPLWHADPLRPDDKAVLARASACGFDAVRRFCDVAPHAHARALLRRFVAHVEAWRVRSSWPRLRVVLRRAGIPAEVCDAAIRPHLASRSRSRRNPPK